MNVQRKLMGWVLLLVLLVGCGRKNRFDFIDIAASERTFTELRAGFEAADTVAGLGRGAYLDTQGLPVADILVYAGDDSLSQALLDIPYGYDSQSIGTQDLLEQLQVKNGRLYTYDGRNARILYLQTDRMPLAVLNKIASLAEGGALIGGMKPTVCTSGSDAVFRRTVEKVWMSRNVMSGKTLKSVLSAAGVKPDVRTRVDSLRFTHRRLPNAEIYHLCNDGSFSGRAKLQFRVVGRQPYVWNPDTGELSPVSYKLRKRATRVRMNMVPGDDTFVVFCSFADRRKYKVK